VSIVATQWSKRVEVTGTSPAATLSGYVALITEANLPADVFNVALNGGGDLRVCLNSDGTGQLPLEVVSFDNVADTAQLWVRFPTYSSSARSCWLFYGKAGETQPLFTNEFGRNSVWADYELVFHGNSPVESTGNITPTLGNVTLSSDSKFGSSYSFNGSNSRIDFNLPTNPANSAIWTLQAWAKVTNNVTSNGSITSIADKDVTNSQDRVTTENNSDVSVTTFGGTGGDIRGNTGIANSNYAWNLYEYQLDSGTANLFVNNVNLGNSSATGNVTAFDRVTLGATADSTPVFWFNGHIQEARLSYFNLTPARRELEYANQNAPNTFWTTGTPESTGSADTTISGAFSFAPFEFSGNASATLPQPISNSAFDLPELTIAGAQSASLPQPIISGAFSFNALDFSGSQSATLPQPISSASFELPVFSVSGDISASLPDNTVTSTGAFSFAPFDFSGAQSSTQPQPTSDAAFDLPSLTLLATQSASLPQPTVSGAFTLPALTINGSMSLGIPQPIVNGSFELPGFTFSGSSSATFPQPTINGSFELPEINVLGSVSLSGVVINVENSGIIILQAGDSSIKLDALSNQIFLH